MKYILILFLIVGCASSTHRLPAASESICSGPVDVICKKASDPREKMIEDYAAPFKKQALKEAADAVGLDKADVTIDDFKNFKSFKKESKIIAKKRKLAFRIYFSRLNELIMDDILRRVGDESRINEMFKIQRVKSYLSAALKNNVSDRAVQKKMLAVLNEIKLTSVNSLLNIHNEQLNNELTNNYYDGCGFEGLSDNAFAFTQSVGKKKLKLIVPCAGTIIVVLLTIEKYVSENEFFTGMLVTLGHEMSHHFDGQIKEFSGAYNELNRCLLDTAADGFKPEEGKPDQTKQEKLFSHIGEITADYWGAQALAEYMTENKFSEAEKLKLMTINFSDLCDAKDDGVHPDGTFRIEFSKNIKSLGRALQCTSTPSCQLNGWN